MCQYLSKTEDQRSQTMKQAAKEAFENNIHHHDTVKTIANAYFSSRACSVQEAVHHILPELNLSKICIVVYFVGTNLSEETVQVLHSEKELTELPYDSRNILTKSNTDRHIERQSGRFNKYINKILVLLGICLDYVHGKLIYASNSGSFLGLAHYTIKWYSQHLFAGRSY